MCRFRLELEYVLRTVLTTVVDLSVQNLSDRLDGDLELALGARRVERHSYFFPQEFNRYMNYGLGAVSGYERKPGVSRPVPHAVGDPSVLRAP